MDLNVESATTDDGIVVLTVSGSVDLTTTPGLRDSLVRLVDEGHHRLVLELSGVDLIDSIGLGVIVGMVHRLRPHDGSLAVAAPSSQARTVLEITQLVRVVGCHATVDDALAAVRGGHAGVSTRGRPGEPTPAG
jgi:anti-sigma B factor antagonist